MLPIDREPFVKALTALRSMKPGGENKLTKEQIEIWWKSMQSWSIEDFAAACLKLVSSVEFMPSPFHFEQLRKAGEMTPGEAWIAVLKMSLDWRNPQPDSRLLRAANAVGGLRRIALADEEHDLPFIEKRFKDAYEDLDRVEPIRDALPQIARPSIRIAGLKSLSTVLPQLQESERKPAVVVEKVESGGLLTTPIKKPGTTGAST